MMSIDREELDRQLSDHQAWIDSAGVAGRQLWLPGAVLTGVDLSGRDLTEAHLEGAVLDDARLDGALLWRVFLAGGSLLGASLAGAQLAKANLDRVRAADARLSGANLLRCSFFEADLRGAVLDGATLTRTLFAATDLRSSSFRGAHLDRTDLDGATFGRLEAIGASGTFMADDVSIETANGISGGTASDLLALFRAAGAADVSVFDTAARPTAAERDPVPPVQDEEPLAARTTPSPTRPDWYPDPTGRHEHRLWDGRHGPATFPIRESRASSRPEPGHQHVSRGSPATVQR